LPARRSWAANFWPQAQATGIGIRYVGDERPVNYFGGNGLLCLATVLCSRRHGVTIA
jgi:hypothetical protein